MLSTPIKILLVEDDELFRLGLHVRLQQETGLEVIAEAEDGETAIELVKQHPLDVVLLDVGLPGIGGIEACQQIKLQYPKLPVLILTSHSQKSLISQLIAVGKTNQEIANLLYITSGTVRVHVHTILHKLDVSHRTQAVMVALEKGLIKGC